METYATDNIIVEYDKNVCLHAGHCVKHLKAVFDPGRSPWINPSAAPADKIIEVVRQCPSGALHYRLRNVSNPASLNAA